MSGRRGGVRARGGGDRGNLVVLEAVLIAIIMLGSIVFVLSYQAPVSDTDRVSDAIEVQARDGLIVLQRQTTPEAAYNGNLLNKVLTEALHGQDTTLRIKFGKYLPAGAGYSVHLDNGYALRDLTATGTPPGEVVTGELAFAPEWSYVFLTTDFRAYHESGANAMNVTGVPVHRSNVLYNLPGAGKVTVNFTNGHDANLTRLGGPPGLLWNASIPADGGAGDGYATAGATERVRSNWTAKGKRFVGSAAYALTAEAVVRDTHDAARAGLDGSTLAVSARNVSLGEGVTVTYDLTAVESAVGPSLVDPGAADAVVEVYAPVAGLAGEPTEWLLLKRWSGLEASGSVQYDAPRNSLYGAHVVVASLNYTLDTGSGAVNQSARLVEHFNVGLKGGTVPPNPIYRAVVAAWFDDW